MPEQGPGDIPKTPGVPNTEASASRPFVQSWVMKKKDEFANLDPKIQSRARRLHQAPDSVVTPDYLRKHWGQLEEQILNGEVPEEDTDLLMAKIAEKIESLEETRPETKVADQTAGTQPQSELAVAVDSIAKAAGDISRSVGELKEAMIQSGQLRPSLTREQIEQMQMPQVLDNAAQQAEQMSRYWSRMGPLEKSRWIDAEYEQEFYTRFTPNMEPHFYTEITSEERKIWDARWKLARATYVKKVYSAFPDKLAENQDLIEFSTEDMETLYKFKGVKPALEWYMDMIVRGKDIELFKHNESGQIVLDSKGQPINKTMTIWDVKFGTDFEKIRRTMRHELIATGVVSDIEDAKSADAIAWNWIYCGNLLESLDSRYSYSGERHDNLAPEICSDDLRAVFHPQEKFEDKCSKRQEWGVFGRWGVQQVDRIKDESKATEKTIIFTHARKRNDYWQWGRVPKSIKIEISAPECYPITTTGSFWEGYSFKANNGRRLTFLKALLKKEGILWKEESTSDPLKVSYLPVRMKRAVGLFEHFFKGEGKPGWVTRLKDYFTRLEMEKGILTDYYKEQERQLERQLERQRELQNERQRLGRNLTDDEVRSVQMRADEIADEIVDERAYQERLRRQQPERQDEIQSERERLGRNLTEREIKLIQERADEITDKKIDKEARLKAKRFFHNLKVWAVYAARGGVGRPQDRDVVDPYSSSFIGMFHDWYRSTDEHNLRQPQLGNYLDGGLFGENLIINSIE